MAHTACRVQGESGCIGLRWDENRLLRQVVLEFADRGGDSTHGIDSVADLVRRVRLAGQLGTGQRACPSKWRIVWSGISAPQSSPRGTQKVRWVFLGRQEADRRQGPSGLLAVSLGDAGPARRIDATSGRAAPSVLRCTTVSLSTRRHRKRIRIGGLGTRPSRWHSRSALQSPNATRPTGRSCSSSSRTAPSAWRSRISWPTTASTCPHAGVFVVREPAPVTREEYLQKIAGQKTLLAQVREKPDQTFAQALAVVHNPIQDLGPMMLSLACDNRKFVAEREGRVLFDTYAKFDDPERPIPTQWQLDSALRQRQGSTDLAPTSPGDWLPMPTTTVVEGDVAYRAVHVRCAGG